MVATGITFENIAFHPALLPTSLAPWTTLHTPWPVVPLQGLLIAMGLDPLLPQ